MKKNRFLRAFQVLRLRGIKYIFYLFSGYIIPFLSYRLFKLLSPRRVTQIFQAGVAILLILISIAYFALFEWKTDAFLIVLLVFLCFAAYLFYRYVVFPMQIKKAHSYTNHSIYHLNFTLWDDLAVSPEVRQAVNSQLKINPKDEIILGNIDNDGRLLGKFGSLPNWVMISEDSFVPRYRFPLDVVLWRGKVLIKKNFSGDRRSFLREWYNLTQLRGKAKVPAIYYVDEKRTLLYKNMILGSTVRDVLVKAGANILSVNTSIDPDLRNLPESKRLAVVLNRGTNLLKACFSEDFFHQLEVELDAIHREGIAHLSLSFGNIMVDEMNTPWFVDFEGCQHYGSLKHPGFLWWRDQDRSKYNQIYGRNIPTEKTVREDLNTHCSASLGKYAPIDFGGGLAVGGFWSVDNGTGRWEYINREVLRSLIQGKRILDLGSNNGIMPIMMLKDGAKEVIGLELDPVMVKSALLVHRIFEWRDMRKYDFQVKQEDMRAILELDWEEFDIVTAYCSLYYLSEEDMVRIVRRASQIAPVIVLQAKIDTRPEAGDNKAQKSSQIFLKKLLEENGFPHVEIFTKKDFSRPLLIGRVSN